MNKQDANSKPEKGNSAPDSDRELRLVAPSMPTSLKAILCLQFLILIASSFALFGELFAIRVAVSMFVAYVFFAAIVAIRTHRHAARIADDVYFTGYILTLLGFCGIALQIGAKPELLDTPANLIQTGAHPLPCSFHQRKPH